MYNESRVQGLMRYIRVCNEVQNIRANPPANREKIVRYANQANTRNNNNPRKKVRTAEF